LNVSSRVVNSGTGDDEILTTPFSHNSADKVIADGSEGNDTIKFKDRNVTLEFDTKGYWGWHAIASYSDGLSAFFDYAPERAETGLKVHYIYNVENYELTAGGDKVLFSDLFFSALSDKAITVDGMEGDDILDFTYYEGKVDPYSLQFVPIDGAIGTTVGGVTLKGFEAVRDTNKDGSIYNPSDVDPITTGSTGRAASSSSRSSAPAVDVAKVESAVEQIRNGNLSFEKSLNLVLQLRATAFRSLGSVHTVLGGEGEDFIAAGAGAKFLKGEGGDDILISLLPLADDNVVVDGGAGNDWVLTFLGEGATTVGGLGRDWIWNTSEGGVIYGDTFNGLDENGNPVNYDDPANSDNFWWWPSTTIMDAQKNDVLKFFGMPLTGGAEGIPIVVSGLAGFLGGGIGDLAAAAAREALGPKYFMDGRLFFDNFAVFMNYIFKQDKYGNLGLYVANAFNGLASLFGNHDFSQTGDGTSLRGAMKVANFDVPVSYWGAAIAQAPRGTLGMKFLLANPALAALALLPPIAGLSGAMFETIHKVIALADAAERFAKAMRWSNPRPGDNDPLVLDLDGDGIELISIATAGVRFDDNNNYFSEETGWLKGDDGPELFDAANDNVLALSRAA
jgi:hypothetical protein